MLFLRSYFSIYISFLLISAIFTLQFCTIRKHNILTGTESYEGYSFLTTSKASLAASAVTKEGDKASLSTHHTQQQVNNLPTASSFPTFQVVSLLFTWSIFLPLYWFFSYFYCLFLVLKLACLILFFSPQSSRKIAVLIYTLNEKAFILAILFIKKKIM